MADIQTITLNKTVIDAVDLSHLRKYIEWHENSRYFELEAGKEHYKLLAYLSTQMTCKRILDIGCYLGQSSCAMSISEGKEIVTIDVVDCLPDDVTTVKQRTNVSCIFDTTYLNYLPTIVLGCDLIVLDIDHTGMHERLILQKLRDCGYTGMVVLDDIHLNNMMRAFYRDIPELKIDISKYGHWSGTACVIFDTERFNVVCE